MSDNTRDSKSFKFKSTVTGRIPFDSKIKDVEVTGSWQYLDNFSGTLEMLLINFEKTLILTWSVHFLIMDSTDERALSITNTKLHVPKGALSAQDNSKLLKQLESGLKRTINWVSINQLQKYKVNVSIWFTSLITLIASFKGVKRQFVWKWNKHSKTHGIKMKIKDCKIMIDDPNIFDQPVKKNIWPNKSDIEQITTVKKLL